MGGEGEEEIRIREAVGFLGGNSRTGTRGSVRVLLSSGKREEAGVGVVGRVLTRETAGRLPSASDSVLGDCCDEPMEPTVVDKGLRRTLAPLIKSCCIPLSNCGGPSVVDRNCSGGGLKSKACSAV